MERNIESREIVIGSKRFVRGKHSQLVERKEYLYQLEEREFEVSSLSRGC